MFLQCNNFLCFVFSRRKRFAKKLASLLPTDAIRSKNVRNAGGALAKGYARADFHDAWERYVNPIYSETQFVSDVDTPADDASGVTSVTPVTDLAGDDVRS